MRGQRQKWVARCRCEAIRLLVVGIGWVQALERLLVVGESTSTEVLIELFD